MSPARALAPPRRILLPLRAPRAPQHARRKFLTLPPAPPQTLAASRRLPYPPAQLYELIADVDSYVSFLPYCQVSRVTHWTTPSSSSSHTSSSSKDPASGRRWPARADLTAGWGGFRETYTSRLFCVPALGIVEAISGDARSQIPASELRKHGLVDPGPDPHPIQTPGSGNDGGGVFKSLVTRWTVTPAAGGGGGGGERGDDDEESAGWSDVRLTIRYQFANPLYMAVSSAVADKVAPVMVEAFVERARRILGEPGKEKEKNGAEALR